MQALVGWSRKLEPLPERLASLDRSAFTVHECQTRVDLFPEARGDGTVHFMPMSTPGSLLPSRPSLRSCSRP